MPVMKDPMALYQSMLTALLMCRRSARLEIIINYCDYGILGAITNGMGTGAISNFLPSISFLDFNLFIFSSTIWDTVPSDIREKLLLVKDDGEFWMEYTDFVKIFDYLDICHRNPNFFRKNDSARWKTFMTDCSWIPGVNNGGTPRSAGKFKAWNGV